MIIKLRDMSKMFTCEKIHMDIPEESQRGFCAKKYRIAGECDICLGCETGKAASKADAAAVRSALQPTSTEAHSAAGKRSAEIRESEKKAKEAGDMASKKKCSCGCGKNSLKDGLAWGCYKKKHGVDPYPRADAGSGTKAKKSAKARPGQARQYLRRERRAA